MNATGSNDNDGPHGMARYGTEWRHVYPVDGRLIVPADADEFTLIGPGGRGVVIGPDFIL